jgi:hypothetical protein
MHAFEGGPYEADGYRALFHGAGLQDRLGVWNVFAPSRGEYQDMPIRV